MMIHASGNTAGTDSNALPAALPQPLAGTSTPASAAGTVTPQLPDSLYALRAKFPGHKIGLENLRGKFRYVARARQLGLNPHTVVTNDLDELAAVLAQGGWPDTGTAP
jgi:hypothetical protein